MASFNDGYSLPGNLTPSSPISILDIFFPGFTNISAAFQQLQTANTNSYAQMFCICGLVVFFGRYAYKHLKAFVETYFTYTIHVSDSNEAYDMLVTWASSQPFTDKASSALASVGARRRGLTNDHSDECQKKLLKYSPWQGTFYFWHKRHLFIYRTMQSGDRFFVKEEISVSCIGTSPAILKGLFSECRTEYLKLVKNKTSIFEHHGADWQKTNTVDIRELGTVILSKEKKRTLLDDINSFLDLESRAWYARRGIPYRRGYLLYGPPGTGKSSLSLSIAGECGLDVYILSLTGVDDNSLRELFAELPARCVVLLEDVDAANCTHSRQRDVTLRRDNENFGNNKCGGELSLSALLNAIDGVGSQEGRLLIMTTNHMEHLDAALTRPGRVDMKLELGLTTRDVNAQLFASIFRSNISDNKKAESEKEKEETMLKQLAADFASKVPEDEFSPADIQLFLLGYRKSPAMAVQNMQEWVVRARAEKRHTKRADTGGSGTPVDERSACTPTQDAQAGEMASPTALVETPAVESHCCSCQILDEIMAVCRADAMPSVEQSLLFNHLSDLEAYRGTHADRAHSTHGFLDLLLNFAKKTYTFSAESDSTLVTGSSNSSSLPPPASSDFLTLSQPASKIADLNLEKFWDEKGWEHIVFDSEDAAPRLSCRLHPMVSFDSGSSEMSPDSASSGTSFESGSEISSDAESIVEHVNKREGVRVAAKCELYQHPATPPASPELSTPAVQSDSEGNETRPSSGFARALEDALKDARSAES